MRWSIWSVSLNLYIHLGMPKSPSLEERLAAIEPPKVTRQTQAALESLIDGLAAELPEEQSLEMPNHKSASNGGWWGTAAALFVAALGVTSAFMFSSNKTGTAKELVSVNQPAIQLVAMEDSPAIIRIEEEIQGESVIQVGSEWPVQSKRYRIVTEHKLIDSVTGTVITVLEPSEQLELSNQQIF